MQFKGLSWTLEAVGNCSLTRRKKQQTKIQKSCNFQKYDLGKGHVVQWVVTGDSKAIWGPKKKVLMGR
jgi:hypothetical protein